MNNKIFIPPPNQLGNYKILEQIGLGGFSYVYKAIHIQINIEVAIKVIPKERLSEELFYKELTILKILDHPFCNHFFEFLEDQNNWYLVTEYLSKGTILQEINIKGKLSENLSRHIFCQLISALDYLHNDLKIVHRDLKAENILFDENLNIKLIDFGLSNLILENNNNLLKTPCGSPAYAPPEMIKGQLYSQSTDIWSIGIILYSLLTGKLPFNENNLNKLATKIVFFEPDYPLELSNEIIDLLKKLLEKNEKDRITINEIFNHSWFKKYPFFELMNKNFGLNQNLRYSKDLKHIDIKIINELELLNLSTDRIIKELHQNQINKYTAPYWILKKFKNNFKMKDLFEKIHKISKIEIIPLPPVTLIKPIFLPKINNKIVSLRRRTISNVDQEDSKNNLINNNLKFIRKKTEPIQSNSRKRSLSLIFKNNICFFFFFFFLH